MQIQIECITPDTSIEDVARLLFEKGINGIPVCKKKKLVGFITQRDILNQLYPASSEVSKTHPRTYDFEKMEGKVSRTLQLTAQDIMSTRIVTISPQTPLLKALSLMFMKKIGRLPVIDQKNSLVGMVTKADIFKSLVGDKLALAENEEYNDWMAKYVYSTLDWKKRLQFEIPDIVSVLNEHHSHRILDVGCGTGEHAIELSKEGFEVTGIERSKLMIQEAKKNRNALPKYLQRNVSFMYGEYENMFPDLKNVFDTALFMGDALAHNPYNYQKVFRKTSQKLKDKALLILQLRNMEKILKDKRKSISIKIQPSRIEHYHQHMFVDFYHQVHNEHEIFTRTTAVLNFNGGKWAFSGLKSTQLINITKQKIASMLRSHGFHNVEYYGTTTRWDYLFKNPFDPKTSEWLNVIAKR